MPDLSDLYSKGASVVDKVNQLKQLGLEKANIPGLTSITDGAKGAVMNVVSRFKKQDLAAGTSVKNDGKTPETSRNEQQKYEGTLTYPAEMKYYTKFTFIRYNRTNVLIDAKDLPQVHIILPLPGNMQENFSIGYDSPAMGPLAGMAIESLRGIQSAPSLGEGLKKFWADANLDKVKSAIGQTGYLALRGMLTGITEGFDKNGVIGKSVDIATGLVPNPHLTLIFSNVDLRQHSFRYLFAPNSYKELLTLKEIVRTLKKRMLPTLAGSAGMLLSFPDTVDITFGPTKDQPYKIKRCVLAGLNVNYTPMNSPAMFKTGDPVAVSLEMQFKEIDQYTRDDVANGMSDLGFGGN